MDFFRICLMFFQRGLYMITKLNNRELFQFCEQFSIILRSGMSAIEGLAILNDDSQTERGKEILTFLYKDMEESGLFKAMELRLISLGFQAGASDEVMEKLAEQYEEKSTDSVSHIVSILEPTIVIVLSILVGLVLLSVMMPLLGLLSEMIA